MERSQYLAALLASSPQAPQQPQTPDLAQMQAMAQQGQQAQAWKAQNPGQSYMGHNMQQMGQNAMSGLQKVGGLFGLGGA